MKFQLDNIDVEREYMRRMNYNVETNHEKIRSKKVKSTKLMIITIFGGRDFQFRKVGGRRNRKGNY